MEPRTFYYSKGASIFYFVALMVFAGLSIWGLASADLTVGKKIFAGILLPSSLYIAYNLLKGDIKAAYKRKPALLMDEKGFYVEQEGMTISWNNIDKVKIISTGHGNELYIYLKSKNVKSGLQNESTGKDYINIFPFRYSGGDFIFDTLRAFCYQFSSGEVMFSRPQPETWPSEG